MSNERDTLADIEAWLRDPKIKSPMRKTWRDVLADRIKEAAKREREAVTNCNQNGNAAACTDCMTIDDAISHAEEVANASDTPCARQHRKLADWLRELKLLRKSNDKRCNAAAMREALEYVLQFDATDEAAEQDGLTDAERIAEYADHISECQKKARAALAEPVRNCDLKECSTIDGMIAAHERFCKSWHADGNYCSECPYNPRAQQMITCQAMWLLAPAAERKGDSDGR